jgi:hypothetical protein
VPFDVLPDGGFIVNTLVDRPESVTLPVVVRLNWQSALRR